MNSALFLVARLSLTDASADAAWLVDDGSAVYQACDVLDLPERVLSRVFELYERTYRSYGDLLIPHQDGLIKYNRWVLFLAEGAPLGTALEDLDPAAIVAFALMRTTRFGLKAGLRGSDGTPQGKKAVLAFATTSYNANGVFGEISGKLEKAVIDKVRVVPVRDAKRLLRELGKADVVPTKDEHYRRGLANIGEQEKVMVGVPWLPS